MQANSFIYRNNNLNGIKIHDVKTSFLLDNLSHMLYCKFDLSNKQKYHKIKCDILYARKAADRSQLKVIYSCSFKKLEVKTMNPGGKQKGGK